MSKEQNREELKSPFIREVITEVGLYPFKVAMTSLLNDSWLKFYVICFAIAVLLAIYFPAVAATISLFSGILIINWIMSNKGKAYRLVLKANKYYLKEQESIAMTYLMEATEFFEDAATQSCIDELQNEFDLIAYVIKVRQKEAIRRIDLDQRSRNEKRKMFSELM